MVQAGSPVAAPSSPMLAGCVGRVTPIVSTAWVARRARSQDGRTSYQTQAGRISAAPPDHARAGSIDRDRGTSCRHTLVAAATNEAVRNRSRERGCWAGPCATSARPGRLRPWFRCGRRPISWVSTQLDSNVPMGIAIRSSTPTQRSHRQARRHGGHAGGLKRNRQASPPRCMHDSCSTPAPMRPDRKPISNRHTSVNSFDRSW